MAAKQPTSFAGRAVVPGARRELVLLAFMLAAIVATLVAVTAAGLYGLAAVRGYVGGEGLWSKGQKDAVYHLALYALTHDASEYGAYRESISVPMADAEARRELQKAEPDMDKAAAWFVEGRNHPDDVYAMANLFRWADWLPEMARAIEIWGEADELVEELHGLAVAIDGQIRGGQPNRAEVQRLLARVREVNVELTRLEDDFSYTLGAGARRLRARVEAVTVAAAITLLGIAFLASWRLIGRMRRSDARFRSMIEHGHDIITVLRPDGRAVYVSPAIERVLGFGPGELVGQNVFDFLHPEDHQEAVEGLGRAMQEREHRITVEVRLRHRDGGYRMVAATGSPFPDDAGQPPSVVVNARDITEERNLIARLQEAARMESVGRLAGGIAHDFNNILTAIMGSSDLAAREVRPGSEAERELDEIRRSAERAADLTRQLLAFARRQVVEPQVFDLNAVVRAMENMLRRLIDETIDFRMTTSGAPLPVRADPAQMQQVLLNLAINARDAMPAGGTLGISTRSVEIASGEAAVETEGTTGSFARLEVRDTGEAMTPEVKERIFEPFFTTKEQGKGTGLGLATCYGIVRQCGGFISVKSEPSRGTVFCIHIPQADAEAVVRRPAPAALPTRGRGTLLVVEDEPAVRRIAVRSLEGHGYRVLSAGDGVEALEVSRESAEPIDLLLTDVVMPRMGGHELAQVLCRERPGIAVLYISGYTGDERFQRVLEDPEVDFLQKPFLPAALSDRVDEILARHRAGAARELAAGSS